MIIRYQLTTLKSAGYNHRCTRLVVARQKEMDGTNFISIMGEESKSPPLAVRTKVPEFGRKLEQNHKNLNLDWNQLEVQLT